MYQVRYVLAAARTLNFTRAAHECNVSQPALTKGIKTLEETLGTPIFYREGKRILLSDFGQSMLPHLQQIVDEAAAARELAQSFRLLSRAPLRLGVMTTIGHLRLARFLSQFGRSHPGIELAVQEAAPTELIGGLTDGDFDIAVLNSGARHASDFRHMPLYSERYIVVFPPEHRLAGLDAIRLSDLSGDAYVDRLACEMREMVMAACAEAGVELYARFRSEREDWVQAMVLAGIGFAFMPEYSVTLPGLLQRPLVHPTVERKIALATAPGRPHSHATAAFLRAARSFPWPG